MQAPFEIVVFFVGIAWFSSHCIAKREREREKLALMKTTLPGNEKSYHLPFIRANDRQITGWTTCGEVFTSIAMVMRSKRIFIHASLHTADRRVISNFLVDQTNVRFPHSSTVSWVRSLRRLDSKNHEEKGINSKSAFFGANERSKGEGEGEREIGSEALAETGKKSQTPQPEIEPGTPANAADALPLGH